MHQFDKYSLLIFDCDGVLINSNNLKVKAMEEALFTLGIDKILVHKCSNYFANNFGKSRYYHIDYFVNNILDVNESDQQIFKSALLTEYSRLCEELYLTAEISPFVEELLKTNQSVKYVASGSDQSELRNIFRKRDLDKYFEDILGSPEKKAVNVSQILNNNKTSNAVMIGDAISDLEAARDNNIDFIFYRPLSNVKNKMVELCNIHGYRIIDSFKEVLE
jgi:phosphoglycolate phosphatase-like HAD superfamily hydrolase